MTKKRKIVFYDADCGFCQASVRIILARDKKEKLLFAPLQGKTYQEIQGDKPSLEKATGLKSGTLVYQRDNELLMRSDAIIAIGTDLGGINKTTIVFKIIPRVIRDYFYRIIARNRKRIPFLKDDYCQNLTPQQKLRFLE